MAAAVSALGGELGLRLLLTPAASHVIVRTACTVVGIGFPVYSTHKAIETNNHTEQEEWLVYWAAYGCFSVAEVFSDKLLSWCPFYYHAKFVFLVWLQLPKNFGARHLYSSLLRPLLLKHHVRLDRIVDGTRNEMNKFFVSHQHEVQAVQRMLKKFSIVVYQAAQDALQSARALEGGSNPAGSRSSQESITPPPLPSPADSTYDESTDDAGWIYTDHPRQSDQ
jgi:receptor expression-enhancing protein 5/6